MKEQQCRYLRPVKYKFMKMECNIFFSFTMKPVEGMSSIIELVWLDICHFHDRAFYLGANTSFVLGAIMPTCVWLFY